MLQRPWQPIGLGWLLAMLALIGCALVAWAHLEVSNAPLWLIACLALALLLG